MLLSPVLYNSVLASFGHAMSQPVTAEDTASTWIAASSWPSVIRKVNPQPSRCHPRLGKPLHLFIKSHTHPSSLHLPISLAAPSPSVRFLSSLSRLPVCVYPPYLIINPSSSVFSYARGKKKKGKNSTIVFVYFTQAQVSFTPLQRFGQQSIRLLE